MKSSPRLRLLTLALIGVTANSLAADPKGPPLSPLKPAVSELPFMISYWCGPPKAETTSERYKELAECGFNVAFAAIDNLWSPNDKAQEEHNLKLLDLCKEYFKGWCLR